MFQYPKGIINFHLFLLSLPLLLSLSLCFPLGVAPLPFLLEIMEVFFVVHSWSFHAVTTEHVSP